MDLLADTVVERGHTGIEDMAGPDWLTTRRKLVNDTHVEIAIKCHGKGTGDGSGCHHQYVGRVHTLAPQFGALSHAETVLLVDDDKTETCELHRVFDDGMSAHKNLYAAVHEPFQHLLASFAFDNTCQQGYAKIHVLQESHHGLQVLFCENLGRCHDACLIAVVDSNEHRHECHEGLT